MNSYYVALMLFTSFAGEQKSSRWDFEDAAVGKAPVGWTAAKTGKGEGSIWKIAEDPSAPKGPRVLFQSAAGPSSLFSLCVADKSSFTDVDLTVAFKSVAGKKDQGGGPLWRFKDSDNYYVVRANPLEDNFRVYKVVAGKRVQLATVDVEVASAKWHTIRVVHKGDHIQCYLNGKRHLDVKDAELKQAGKVGLWTKADAQTYFDDLVVRKAE